MAPACPQERLRAAPPQPEPVEASLRAAACVQDREALPTMGWATSVAAAATAAVYETARTPAPPGCKITPRSSDESLQCLLMLALLSGEPELSLHTRPAARSSRTGIASLLPSSSTRRRFRSDSNWSGWTPVLAGARRDSPSQALPSAIFLRFWFWGCLSLSGPEHEKNLCIKL